VSVPATADLSRRLRELAGRDHPDLFEGALLISALIDPTEDLEAARRAVTALARRVRRQADERGEPAHLALQRVLFAEEGFRGDEESYDDPANSSVARVISRRRGMPITLSIVAIEVGRLAGLRLEGIGLPGHFVVGGPDLPEGRFLDAFDAGRIYDAEGLSRRVETIFGSPVTLGPDLLAADPPRAILARVLLNLRRSLERRDLWETALAALDLSQTLEPDSPAKKVFTLDEARALMPRVRALTEEAVSAYARLGDRLDEERQSILREWAREIQALGAEIKGLWLVDFDSGAGYYCWKYPEPALDHFHGYEEGFAGRLPLQ
jgi:regulator of sirC expression with transglutaminase-like and TPR domain